MIDRVNLNNDEPETNEQSAQTDPAQDRKARREAEMQARKDRFEAQQEAQRKQFEQQQAAMEARAERQEAEDLKNAERAQAIADAQRENDEKGLSDGLITHDDLLARQQYLSQHHSAMMPHEALAPNEDTVKMAFPHNTILTLSATDIKRIDGDDGQPVPSPIVHGSRVLFLKGYNDVPVGLSDHAYLASNGAYRLGSDGKPETEEARAQRMSAAKESAKAAKKAPAEDKDKSAA